MNRMIIGTVFDIQRFALHDGPGIRTTVFLKGCPLRCQWCHNPESISPQPQLGFFKERCTLCGACVKVCPNGVHRIEEKTHLLLRDNCTACGACVEVCLNNALTISGKKMTVDEVMDIVIKDKAYYNQSGGGLTISGGEPLLQSEFIQEILVKAKSEGIQTCVDTSGFVRREILQKIMDDTDLFLFDYKATDETKHKELTGQSNQRILKNLQFLHDSGKKIILRCPLIPDVNDDEEHLKAICELEQNLSGLSSIHILPFHSTGASKYERYGIQNPLQDHKSSDSAYSEKIMHWFEQQGCHKVVIDE